MSDSQYIVKSCEGDEGGKSEEKNDLFQKIQISNEKQKKKNQQSLLFNSSIYSLKYKK